MSRLGQIGRSSCSLLLVTMMLASFLVPLTAGLASASEDFTTEASGWQISDGEHVFSGTDETPCVIRSEVSGDITFSAKVMFLNTEAEAGLGLLQDTDYGYGFTLDSKLNKIFVYYAGSRTELSYTPELRTWYELKLQKLGSTYYAYVNNVLVHSYTYAGMPDSVSGQACLLASRVGIRYYKDVSVESAGEPQAGSLSDFSLEVAGQDALGWTEHAGDWSVSYGECRIRETSTARDLWYYSTRSGQTVADDTIKVKLWLSSPGNEMEEAGVIARYQDANNHYRFVMMPSKTSTELRLVKREGGTDTVLAQATAEDLREAWHELKFVLNGSALRGYLDDELVCSATDDSFATGLVGLMAHPWNSSGGAFEARFDDFVVGISPPTLSEEMAKINEIIRTGAERVVRQTSRSTLISTFSGIPSLEVLETPEWQAPARPEGVAPSYLLDLISPQGGAWVNEGTITFEWAASESLQIQRYDLYIDGELYESTSSTSLTVTLRDGSHTWHVVAIDPAGREHYPAAARTVQIDTTPPVEPMLLSPGAGLAMADAAPRLRWNVLSDLSGVAYELQVDDSQDFSTPEVVRAGLKSSNLGLAELSDGTWYWRVRAVDGAGNAGSWSSGSFVVDTAPPAAPALNSPVDGVAVAESALVFSWGAVNDQTSVSYQLQISGDAGFSYPLIARRGLSAAEYDISGFSDGIYYWRVRAVDSAKNEGPWASSSFTVDVTAPPSPLLLAPVDGVDTEAPDTPTLDADQSLITNSNVLRLGWRDVVDLTGVTYEAQVDDDADFSSPVVAEVGLDITAYTTSELADGIYHWRVRAVDGVGNVGEWSTGSITIDATAPPALTSSPLPVGVLKFNITPKLDWYSVNDFTGVTYEVQVDDDPDFSSPMVAKSGLTDTELAIAELGDGIYHWRVRAVDGAGNAGGWGTHSFTIDSTMDDTARFVWDAVPPGTYHVQATSGSGLISAGAGIDTDKDGISDELEENLRRMGYPANALRRDVFLEIDRMEGARTLDEKETRDLINAFKDALIQNPDGSWGIDLHLYYDDVIPAGEVNLDFNSNDYYYWYYLRHHDLPEGFRWVLLARGIKEGPWWEFWKEYLGFSFGPRGSVIDVNWATLPFTQISLRNLDSILMHELGHVVGGLPDRTDLSNSVMNYLLINLYPWKMGYSSGEWQILESGLRPCYPRSQLEFEKQLYADRLNGTGAGTLGAAPVQELNILPYIEGEPIASTGTLTTLGDEVGPPEGSDVLKYSIVQGSDDVFIGWGYEGSAEEHFSGSTHGIDYAANITAKGEVMAGLEAEYDYDVTISQRGLEGQFHAEGFVGVKAEGEVTGDITLSYGELSLTNKFEARGEVGAGAGGQVEGEFQLGADGFYTGFDAGGFVGARASGEASLSTSLSAFGYDIVGVDADVGGSVGVGLGGEIGGDLGATWEDGNLKLSVGLDIGAYLGIGGEIHIDLQITLPIGDAVDALVSVGEAVCDAGKWIYEEGLVPIGEAIERGWATVCDAASDVADAVVNVASAAADVVVDIANTVVDVASDIANTVVDVAGDVWDAACDAVGDAANAIISAASSAWDTVSSFASSAYSGITSFASSAWNTLSDWGSSAWNTVSSAASSAWNGITSFASSAGDVLSTAGSYAWSGLTSIGSGLCDVGSSAVDTLSDWGSSAWDALTGWW